MKTTQFIVWNVKANVWNVQLTVNSVKCEIKMHEVKKEKLESYWINIVARIKIFTISASRIQVDSYESSDSYKIHSWKSFRSKTKMFALNMWKWRSFCSLVTTWISNSLVRWLEIGVKLYSFRTIPWLLNVSIKGEHERDWIGNPKAS